MNADERIAMLASVGYIARAIIYFALGYLSLATGHAEGTTSILDPLAEIPGGNILIVFLAIGLAAYGLFRLYGAAVDLEREGNDAKGIATRAGHVASGFAHFGLAYGAAALFAWGSRPDDGAAGGEATRAAIDLPFGWALILIAGIVFAVAAVSQVKKAWTASFMELLSPRAPHWTKTIGRIGHAARAAVFAALAWTLVGLGWSGRAGEVGFQDALGFYRDHGWLFDAVAFGLLLFGVFSLVMARFRKECDTPLARRIIA